MKLDLSKNQIVDPPIMVEVSDDGRNWIIRELYCINHELDRPYIVKSGWWHNCRLIEEDLYMTQEECLQWAKEVSRKELWKVYVYREDGKSIRPALYWSYNCDINTYKRSKWIEEEGRWTEWQDFKKEKI